MAYVFTLLAQDSSFTSGGNFFSLQIEDKLIEFFSEMGNRVSEHVFRGGKRNIFVCIEKINFYYYWASVPFIFLSL